MLQIAIKLSSFFLMRRYYLKYSEKISEMVLTIRQEQLTPLNL